MQPLFDNVRWQGPDRAEECCVLTRSPRLLFFHLPRTKVFHKDLPVPSGILWWRGVDDVVLADLHRACLRICSEVGLTVFCQMCQARGEAGRRYWEERLGDLARHLRGRT